jgi:2-oxoglutarate ferredoxin oxidoreductase subunit gamma
MTTERSVILAGFGGQGLLFAGTVLARAALHEGKEVLWIPSYGPEMRGGTAACTVIISDAPVGSPVVDRLDLLIALNAPSLARYAPLLARGGLAVVNASLVRSVPHLPGIEVVLVPATSLAADVGDERLTCVIALGSLLACRPVVTRAATRTALIALLSERAPGMLDTNLAALDAGLKRIPRERAATSA